MSTRLLSLRSMPGSLDPDSPPSDSSSSSDESNVRFLALEPESDHASDSDGTKRSKRAARRKYRAQLNLLKYQQGFLKLEPPLVRVFA